MSRRISAIPAKAGIECLSAGLDSRPGLLSAGVTFFRRYGRRLVAQTGELYGSAAFRGVKDASLNANSS